MADFKKQGGSLTGREERYDGFEGEPRAVGGALGGGSSGVSGSHSTTSGPHNSNLMNKADPRVDSDRDGSRNMGATGTGYGSGTTGSGYGSGTTGSGYGSSTTQGPHSSNMENKIDPRVDSDGSRGYGSGTTGTGYGSGTTGTTGTTGKKPGLMDKLNPMKDTDGDGKKGFME